MDAIIYTRVKEEYEFLRETLLEEVKIINIEWAVQEEGCRDYAFDLLVTTMEPEEAFDIIEQHQEKTYDIQIIMICDDSSGMREAFHYHVFDYCVRPLDMERLRRDFREVVPKCPRRYEWYYDPSKQKERICKLRSGDNKGEALKCVP